MRRRALLLAGGGLAASAALLAGRSRPALGYGPLSLGMPRAAALRLLGPGAAASPLCSGAEGVLFDCDDAALSPVPGRPVPAMAMFGDGRVSEMEATLSDAVGGRAEDDWHALVAAQLAEMRRRTGADFVPATDEDDPLGTARMGASRSWRLVRPDGVLHLRARWMRRSGACFTRLHWVATGVSPVIG